MAWQIRRVLERTGIDRDAVRRILLGVERKWIEQVVVDAIDGADARVAELEVAIDWTRDELAVSSGREVVSVDGVHGALTEIEDVLARFDELCVGDKLTMRVRIRYVEGVDADVANETLRLQPAGQHLTATAPDLREYTVGVRYVHLSQAALMQGLRAELARFVGPEEPDPAALLERAARIVTAEQSWRRGLGLLLDEDDVAQLLNVDRGRVGELADGEEMIVLTKRDGTRQFPAFQFQDGAPAPTLARAHRTLVQDGRISPWSAASWARTAHPELELRSPAQWAGEHRDAEVLLAVAARDAARLAQ